MASGVPDDEDGVPELISMWVSPATRGRGTGEKLMGAAAQILFVFFEEAFDPRLGGRRLGWQEDRLRWKMRSNNQTHGTLLVGSLM